MVCQRNRVTRPIFSQFLVTLASSIPVNIEVIGRTYVCLERWEKKKVALPSSDRYSDGR
jgi:hypothetical protein